MLLTSLAIACGLIGLMTGLLALRSSRRAVDDCLGLLSRRAPADGLADPRAIRDVAVCRYDALEEMTGQRSFSVALLNGMGDGLVLTSINGRTETRTYVRPVRAGRGMHDLSPEEEQAVRAARLGQGPEVTAPARTTSSVQER